MRMMILFSSVAAFAALSACQEAPPSEDVPTVETEAADSASVEPATHGYADWAGKWTGVEGMYVTITATTPGTYDLEMQSDLDTKGNYIGKDSKQGIAFQRGDETLTLHRTNGDATGLKYLAGKKVCLTVKAGEGYCRD